MCQSGDRALRWKKPIPVRIRVHCYNEITLKHIGHYEDTCPSDCIPRQIDGRLGQYDNTVGYSCNKIEYWDNTIILWCHKKVMSYKMGHCDRSNRAWP